MGIGREVDCLDAVDLMHIIASLSCADENGKGGWTRCGDTTNGDEGMHGRMFNGKLEEMWLAKQNKRGGGRGDEQDEVHKEAASVESG